MCDHQLVKELGIGPANPSLTLLPSVPLPPPPFPSHPPAPPPPHVRPSARQGVWHRPCQCLCLLGLGWRPLQCHQCCRRAAPRPAVRL
ncbi:unnamed protein product [Closterium sp. NIES-54]